MVETLTGAEDKPATAAPVPDGEGSTAPASDKPDSFLLDFPDKEAASEGFKNLQGAKTKAEQDNADLRKRLESLESEQGIGEKIASAISATKSSAEPTEAEVAAEREKILEELGGGPEAEATLRLIQQNNAAGDARLQAALDDAKQARAELEKRVAGTLSDQDPRYVANKELITKLESDGGMTREQALKAVEIIPAGPIVAGAPPGPGGGTTEATAVTDAPKVWSDQEKADYIKFMGDGVTEDELAKASKEPAQ